jgi:hypothetical protein
MTLQTAEYSNFFETTLDGNVAGGDTTITLSALPTSDGTTFIDAPYYLVINPDSTTNREVINVTSHNTGTLQITCTRDVEGRHSPDIPHDTGTTVRMSVVGEMFEDLHDRLNDVALTGDVTGTINSTTQDIATTLASGIDATKIADGSVTSAEFQYIGGLTSDAQTQLDAKATTADTLDEFGNPVAALDINDQELTKFVAKDYKEDVATTSDSGTSFAANVLTLDVQDGNIFDITLDGNITTWTINNMDSGTTISVILRQDATGSRTAPTQINSTTIKTVDGGGLELSTAASAIDVVTVFYDGTDYLVFSQVNMS